VVFPAKAQRRKVDPKRLFLPVRLCAFAGKNFDNNQIALGLRIMTEN
jgi:hypothetical protein